MSDQARAEVTRILQAAADGDQKASEDLLPLVYEELRRLARAQMAAEPADHTLQATALVHEAYLRLLGPGGAEEPKWDNRGHFFGAAARAMRRILIERARRVAQVKRGGGRRRVELHDNVPAPEENPDEMLLLDEALKLLEQRDPRKAEVVMLRYFAGLTVAETAAALGVSPATVKSDFAYARSLLMLEMRRLSGEEGDGVAVTNGGADGADVS